MFAELRPCFPGFAGVRYAFRQIRYDTALLIAILGLANPS